MRSSLTLTALLLTATALTAGTPGGKNPKAAAVGVAPASKTNGWRVSAGPQWRTLGDVSFSNAPQAPSYILPRWQADADASSGDGAASTGTFSDGYVLPDISGSGISTWNFGYTSASQVSGNTLTLHGSGGGTSSSFTSELLNSDWSDDMAGWGGFIQLESPDLLTWKGISLSATAGYSYTRADVGQSIAAFTATQTTTTGGGSFTQTFTAIGALPAAPHAGTFNGPGPIINLVPTSTTGSATGGEGGEITETTVESTIDNELKLDLHTFSFGPKFAVQHQRLRLGCSLGLALNVADWEARTEETLRTKGGSKLANWRSENSGTDVLPGFYLELSAELPITDRLSAYAAGRYDWSRDLHGSTELSEHSLEMSGFTAQVGISFKF